MRSSFHKQYNLVLFHPFLNDELRILFSDFSACRFLSLTLTLAGKAAEKRRVESLNCNCLSKKVGKHRYVYNYMWLIIKNVFSPNKKYSRFDLAYSMAEHQKIKMRIR
jgi:hypothetical protein